MEDLTIDRIIGIHRTIMEKSGGDTRLLSEANLHQMVFQVNGTAGLIPKGALATFLLAAYPPFMDGNKRTACGVLEYIMCQNGYTIVDDGGEMSEILKGVISFAVEQEDIEQWLHTHTHKTE